MYVRVILKEQNRSLYYFIPNPMYGWFLFKTSETNCGLSRKPTTTSTPKTQPTTKKTRMQHHGPCHPLPRENIKIVFAPPHPEQKPPSITTNPVTAAGVVVSRLLASC
jgi:hypothetical protein